MEIKYFLLVAMTIIHQSVSTQTNTTNYIHVSIYQNQSNAELYCINTFGTNLASIHSIDDLNEINELYSTTNSKAWIGFNDKDIEDYWTWTDGSYVDESINNWYPGQPSGYPQHCAYVGYKGSNKWDDNQCSWETSFICNRYPKNVTENYILIKNTMDFDDAETFCNNHYGTHLASIHSIDDLNEINKLYLTTNSRTWIGFNDKYIEGDWTWTDGSYVNESINNWYPGQPSGYTQHCAYVGLYDNHWDDQQCEYEYSFICNRYNRWPTRSPTPAPTNIPTFQPTYNPSNNPTHIPTINPTQSPTVHPTYNPSNYPTISPTTCYDIPSWNTTYTNDGYEQSIIDIISSLKFTNMVYDISKQITTTKRSQYVAKLIMLSHDDKQQLNCQSEAGCNGADIIFEDNTICNLLCNEFVSCSSANVDIKGCNSTDIICDGDYACADMTINIEDDESYEMNVFCGQNTSCDYMIININGNIESTVTCIDINACNSLLINIDSDYYQTNFLHMLSYSNNVTFSNGQGYEPSFMNSSSDSNTNTFITCNTDKHYIKWNSSINILDPLFKQTILSEYTNNKFPCDDITVECAEDNNDTSSCDIHFDITKVPHIVNESISTDDCYWVPVSDIIEIRCDGDCQSSPTLDPTPSPTNIPTVPTFIPTMDPTQEPTVDPTMSPSQPPTSSPSMSPIITPTSAPSQSPTPVPTSDPSQSQTNAPTQPPTNNPTSDPTQSPSASPTPSPTDYPSQPPTAAPSRPPTINVDEIYDVVIDIEYHCYNLSRTNKKFIVGNTTKFVVDFQEIIEQNYFDKNSDLFYSDFWVQVITINGKNVLYTNQGQLLTQNDEALTEYDLDINNILHNVPITLSAKIQCAHDNGVIIIRKSQSPTGEFKPDVTTQLQQYFNNSAVAFTVSGPNGIGTITEQSKFTLIIAEQSEDNTALYLTIFILSIGALWSLISLIHRYFYSNENRPNCGCNKIQKLKDNKSDNAKWWIPFLFSFEIYDFISDINLCIKIWIRDDTELWNFQDILFILALLSTLCIIVPFLSNLWYAVRITKQAAIRNSPDAQTWFASNFPLKFIPLCIICAGTYPVLELTSSHLFGMNFFDAGLLSSELRELSKIKLISTVFMENLPQLLIQIIYSYTIRQLETATVLAFIASSVSIISSFAIYQAHKTQSEDVEICRYYLWLLFADNNAINRDSICSDTFQGKNNKYKGFSQTLQDSLLSADNNNTSHDTYHFNIFQDKINKYKGLRHKLQSLLCQNLGITNSKPIEIGSITIVNEAKSDIIGCKIHLQQSVTQSDKDKASREISSGIRERIAVDGDRYIQHMIKHCKSKIKQCLLYHFHLESNQQQQEIKYIVCYTKEHAFSSHDDIFAPAMLKGSMDHQSVSKDVIEMVDFENDVNDSEGDSKYSKYSILLKGMNEIVNENKALRQMIETNKNNNIDGIDIE